MFEILFGMILWYDLLAVVNRVSKTLQSADIDIDVAIIELKGLVSYLQKYRETRFEIESLRLYDLQRIWI